MENNSFEAAVPRAPKKLNGRRLVRAEAEARQVWIHRSLSVDANGDRWATTFTRKTEPKAIKRPLSPESAMARRLWGMKGLPRSSDEGPEVAAVWRKARSEAKAIRRKLRAAGWVVGGGR